MEWIIITLIVILALFFFMRRANCSKNESLSSKESPQNQSCDQQQDGVSIPETSLDQIAQPKETDPEREIEERVPIPLNQKIAEAEEKLRDPKGPTTNHKEHEHGRS